MNIEEYKHMLEKFIKDEISKEQWFEYCENLKKEAAKAATIINKKHDS